MRLWEIPIAIETIAEMMVDIETGECLSQEEVNAEIEKLEMSRENKIKYLSHLAQEESANALLYAEYEKNFKARKKASEKKVESIKNYLRFCLEGEKWEADDKSVKVSFRTNKDSVKIDTLAEIPDEFFKTPHYESNLNKTAIKERIKGGEEVSGCHLEDTVSTIIK